jgi:hypothetical protein
MPACVRVPANNNRSLCTVRVSNPKSRGIRAETPPEATASACFRPTGALPPTCETWVNSGAGQPRHRGLLLPPRAPVSPLRLLDLVMQHPVSEEQARALPQREDGRS